MSLVRQFVVLSVAGLSAGLASNALSPRPIGLGKPVLPANASATTGTCHAPIDDHPRVHPKLPLAQALEACTACTAVFVDARGEAAFAEGHITQALHLPAEGNAELAPVLAKVRAAPMVIVYDDDAGGCRLAQGVADRLAVEGVKNIRILEGSWTAWQTAQGPAQAGACEVCGHAEPVGESQ
jgi:rhodanese-related sulfurtransferase